MNIVLNIEEQKVYNDYIAKVIPQLAPGIYRFKDFFKGQATSARLARKLYEDVCNDVYPGATLKGTRSREGYIIS